MANTIAIIKVVARFRIPIPSVFLIALTNTTLSIHIFMALKKFPVVSIPHSKTSNSNMNLNLSKPTNFE